MSEPCLFCSPLQCNGDHFAHPADYRLWCDSCRDSWREDVHLHACGCVCHKDEPQWLCPGGMLHGEGQFQPQGPGLIIDYCEYGFRREKHERGYWIAREKRG